jgi:hypothetical protein
LLALVWLTAWPGALRAGDVLGYSILKGQFLLQTGPNALMTDPDFAFSILASVDSTDFDLITNATLRLPNNAVKAMDDLADSWDYLDTRNNFSMLNSAYGWGTYTLTFQTLHDGNFSCGLNFPDTPLPPTPRLTNFAAVQAVNPAKPLTLFFDFSAAPAVSDFVQAYVTDGHLIVWATPDFGQPGALDGTARSTIIPANTFDTNYIYSLNLEITRLSSTNENCYPSAEGVTATFRSTALDLTTIAPPRLRLLSGPTNGAISIRVVADAGQTIVLQGSDNLITWSNLATNADPSGLNTFTVPALSPRGRLYRAFQP